ncbi:hypothetical protein [Lactococcus allomyrinae]|uniref:Uncharacterized protein n=1 Tax=Lactococcus allomyrinae TaxID=2419773 RepID=A0A387BGA9_9LACT|nr:hypothetical protein [Lactococcus allomyrinae]AYG01314.1 hypothetical protein D7I46_09530 [Lactococcus allomyrinae]
MKLTKEQTNYLTKWISRHVDITVSEVQTITRTVSYHYSAFKEEPEEEGFDIFEEQASVSEHEASYRGKKISKGVELFLVGSDNLYNLSLEEVFEELGLNIHEILSEMG